MVVSAINNLYGLLLVEEKVGADLIKELKAEIEKAPK